MLHFSEFILFDHLPYLSTFGVDERKQNVLLLIWRAFSASSTFLSNKKLFKMEAI